MQRTHLITALVGVVVTGIFATDASAMYNPTTGTWMQRDPGGAVRVGAGRAAPMVGFFPRDQYRDGMGLYQYVQSSPVGHIDPFGTQALPATKPATSQASTTQALTPIDISTYVNDIAGGEEGFFADLANNLIQEATRAASGSELLDAIQKRCNKGKCVRTWTHVQHAWAADSPTGNTNNGGFGGGSNGNGSGFYGNDQPNPKPRPNASNLNRDNGGRGIADLQDGISHGRIAFCKPCRIYIYGCRVSETGVFAADLSRVTGCSVYAGQGSVSTTHSDGTAGTSRDPWRAEGGWDIYDNGQRTNQSRGDTYITPTTDWQ